MYEQTNCAKNHINVTLNFQFACIDLRLFTKATFKLYMFSLSICELFIALLEVVYANKF